MVLKNSDKTVVSQKVLVAEKDKTTHFNKQHFFLFINDECARTFVEIQLNYLATRFYIKYVLFYQSQL